ncbi:MAG TPA: protein kinase [Polyangiaceae bacterium]|nr:protein kinase [Polyangiaceae bacterium]
MAGARADDRLMLPFAGYELDEEPLAQGSSALVYRAWDQSRGAYVAIKLMRGEPQNPTEVAAFKREAATARSLGNLPHVAEFLAEGEVEGRPFLVMTLYAGTLADCVERYQERPAAAAKLMAEVARAVAAAHAKGIWHRDLKPANILMSSLDGEGAPFVADFGIAKPLATSSRSTLSHVAGSLLNIAPERVLPARHGAASAESIGVADDVYGLGTLLYELLVGRPPYEGAENDVLRQLLSLEPVPSPASRGVRVARDLEKICLCCLEKRAALRYRSALEVARELDAFLAHKPPLISQLSWGVRVYRYCLRRPLQALAAGVVTVLTLTAATVGLWASREFEQALRRQVLEANMYAAQATAGQVLHLLRGFGDSLQACAENSAVVAHLSATRRSPELTRALATCAPEQTFDSVLLLDMAGNAVDRVPSVGEDYLKQNFSFRDYFVGAQRLAQQRARARPDAIADPAPREVAYVARAHVSEGDGQFKFSISIPIFDAKASEKPRCVGYVMATSGTNSTLASLSFSDPHDPQRVGMLVSLRDRERYEPNVPTPGQLRVLVHQGLPHGKSVTIDGPELARWVREIEQEEPAQRRQFRLPSPDQTRSSDDHRDPVRGFSGRWLAGYARVGETNQLVIVQTSYSILAGPQQLLRRTLECSGALLALGFCGVFAGVRALRKRAWV